MFISKKIIFTVFISLLFIGCGQSLESDQGDSIESVIVDDNLNDGSGDEQQKVCRGIVTTVTSNLNVRATPEIADNLCGQLEPGSVVTLKKEDPENGFISIRSSLCSEDDSEDWAYVSFNFIEADTSCFDKEDPNDNDTDTDEVITDVRSYINSNYTKVSVVRNLTRNGPKGLVEVFKLPGAGTNRMCGIKHIRNYRSEPYQAIDTLCAWTSIAQEWRKKYCPDNSPHCRIMLGDASFGERQPSSWPHSTHRRGWCMDIWPMRNEGCGEKEVTWKQGCYSRSMTKDFVNLLDKHGADTGNQFFFNDPELPHVRKLSNHDDHIHVCFKPSNNTVKKSCSQLKIEKKLCPEF